MPQNSPDDTTGEGSPSAGSSPPDARPPGRLRRLLAARREGDASRGEVFLYAFGNIEGGIATQFWAILQQVMIVAMHVNPLMIGLVLGIKTVWDSVTDPLMAYITDNTRSRWGRRRPYILFGGVLRILMLVFVVLLFPSGSALVSNQYLEKDTRIKEASKTVAQVEGVYVSAYRQLFEPESMDSSLLVPKTQVRESLCKAMEEIGITLQELPSTIEQFRVAVEDRERQLARIEEDQAGEERKTLVERELLLLEKARDSLDDARALQARAELLPQTGELLLAAVDGGAGSVGEEESARIAGEIASVRERERERLVEQAKRVGQPKPGFVATVTDGVKAFLDPSNADQQSIVLFFLVSFLLFTTLTTIQSVPYFALGIELSPSYDGRTQVAVYRSIMDKGIGVVGVWIPAFVFLMIFQNALEGLLWVTVFAVVVGIPSTVLMVIFTRERTQISASAKNRMNFFKSVLVTFKNPHFWRILLLSKAIGFTWGIFMQFGFYLQVYWVMGSALKGAALGGLLSSLAWILTFAALPLVSWGCQRFQKHEVLRVAVVLMAVGAILQWWVVTPKNPYLQLILPFFTSVGISGFYVVLMTMLADVTDADELLTGERREGMFSAVQAFVGKMIGSLVPVLAGLMLVVSGFDPSLEFNQSESTITNMRLLFSFVPGFMMLGALLLLWRYPLSRARMSEIKEELRRRHDAAGDATAEATAG